MSMYPAIKKWRATVTKFLSVPKYLSNVFSRNSSLTLSSRETRRLRVALYFALNLTRITYIAQIETTAKVERRASQVRNLIE